MISNREDRLLWLGALPFLLAFLAWYPPLWTYLDENIYVGIANTLRHGTLYADQAGIQIPFFAWNGHHWVSKYPLGMPALIALFSFVSWKTIFLIGPLAALAAFGLMARWLRFEGLHPWYAWLLLYHPALVFYSRTLMAEVVCLALILAAFYAFRRERFFLAGLLAGFVPHIRISSFLILPILAAGGIPWKGLPAARRVALGILPGLTLLLLYNAATTGSLWVSPYKLVGQEPLSWAYLPSNLGRFSQSLFLIYPLMPVALFTGWRRFPLPTVCVLIFLLFHACVPPSWITGNQWSAWPQECILPARYLLPVVPLFLLLYADLLDRIFRFLKQPPARWLAAGLLFALLPGNAFLHARHQHYLLQLRRLQDAVYETVPEDAALFANYDALRLLNNIRGKQSWELTPDLSRLSARLSALAPEKLVFYLDVEQHQGNRPRGSPPPFMRLVKTIPGELVSLSIYQLERK